MPKEALAGVKQVPDFCFKLPGGPSGCWAEGSREMAAGWSDVRVSLPPGGFSSPAEPGRPVPGSQTILRPAGSLTDWQRQERECEHQLRPESCRGSRREWRRAGKAGSSSAECSAASGKYRLHVRGTYRRRVSSIESLSSSKLIEAEHPMCP